MIRRPFPAALAALLSVSATSAQDPTDATARAEPYAFAEPVRLEADGEPIDIARISKIAHAGPWLADVDGDGDRDLVVGDFPGYFWLFDNEGSDAEPAFTHKGKLQAGGEDAKTPVY